MSQSRISNLQEHKVGAALSANLHLATNAERISGRRASLNVCVAYAFQDEMSSAISTVASVPATSTLPSSTITHLLDASLYTSRNPQWTAPDLLIRTSGVSRISDFLLWQIVEHTTMFVLPCFWPDIGVADVVPVLLAWQAHSIISTVLRVLGISA